MLLVFLLGFVVTANANVVKIQDANEYAFVDGDASTTLITSVNYDYKYGILPQIPYDIHDGFILRFRVRALREAHIAVSPYNYDQNTIYEIVLGDSSNTVTSIGRCKKSCVRRSTSTPNILSGREYREFWIRILNSCVIQVGRGGEIEPFISWSDGSPLQTNYFAFTTDAGSFGDWVFPPKHTVSSCGTLSYETDGEDSYTYGLPTIPSDMSKDFELEFSVKASSRVHIALTPRVGFDSAERGYEIVIGDSGRNLLRRCRNCASVVSNNGYLLSASVFRKFKLSYRESGGNAEIRVWRVGYPPFLSYTDLSPLDCNITAVGFRTPPGISAVFDFPVTGITSGNLIFDTPNYEFYHFDLPVVPSNKDRDLDVYFMVQAYSDVFIALSTSKSRVISSTNYYKIVIGGWSNTQSVIRRCYNGCSTQYTRPNLRTLDPYRLRPFRITYSNGWIRVYQVGEDSPFLSWNDPSPMRIRGFGFSTGGWASGRFAFQTCDLF